VAANLVAGFHVRPMATSTVVPPMVLGRGGPARHEAYMPSTPNSALLLCHCNDRDRLFQQLQRGQALLGPGFSWAARRWTAGI